MSGGLPGLFGSDPLLAGHLDWGVIVMVIVKSPVYSEICRQPLLPDRVEGR